MTIIFSLAVLVCVLGLIIYLVADPAKNPRIVHVGDVMFMIGLFVVLFCGCWGNHATLNLLR